MQRSWLRDIVTHLPERYVTNEELAASLPGWDAARFGEKTGIRGRHVVAPGECSSDLVMAAAQALFARGTCTPATFDFLIFCSETPDYVIPSTSSILQSRLGLPTSCGTIDLNQTCSGYVYTLAVAAGLIESGAARNILLCTSTTYSTMIDPLDRAVRPIFGDAATVSWISSRESDPSLIGPFVFGTDGSGAEHIMVRGGAFRHRDEPLFLRMKGTEVAMFTLRVVPGLIHDLLARTGETLDDVDAFVFHQPNGQLLEQLGRKIGIAPEKMLIDLETTGNTGSSSIPIVLANARKSGRLRDGGRVLLAGFGGGLSWAAGMLTLA